MPLWNVLALPDGKAVIGGEFTTVNGNSRNYLAQLNADGTYEVLGAGGNNGIMNMALQQDGKVLIGGFFTTFNGISRPYLRRLNTDGTLDTSFNLGQAGPNSFVYSISIQADGKIIIIGDFTTYNGVSRNKIARLNPDGSLDVSFNPGTGISGSVSTFSQLADGKIIIAGDFTSFNGISRNRIARLNLDGSIDTSFNPAGPNSSIDYLETQSDGKFLIAGYFSSYNGVTRNWIARLNADGSLDTSFNPGTSVNNPVHTIKQMPDGKILIVGDFTTFNGVSRNRIARLNSNGSLDVSFNIGSGANQRVFRIGLQSDGKILIGGGFTSYNGVSINRIARLNLDGSLDSSFNPGTGANEQINSIVTQTDGKILLGGILTNYNGINRGRIVRIYGDPVIEVDTEAPVLIVENLTQFIAQCRVNFSDLTIPTATDNVDGTIQGTTNQSIFPITQQGSYTITWTFTDAAGNSSTQDQTIIVDDTTAPVPAVAQLPVISGQCSVTVTAATANDACAGTLTGTTTDLLTYDAQGTYTITWTYDDGNGNTSTQTQTVIVDDTTAPVPAVAQLPVASGQCSVTVTAPTANDACEGTITGTTTDPLTYDAQGTYTITWTYDDGNGNTSTQTQTVIVDDTTAPVPAVAQLPTISSQCSVTVTTPPTANDACKGTITGTTTDPLTYDAQGNYTITWTYDDGNGNTSTQTQTVIVDDTTAPVPALPQLPVVSGQCAVTVTAPTANDACKGTIIGTTTAPLTYDAQGTYTITWTYDDGNGNTSTQTQTVIVDDTTAPVPAVAQLPVISGQCSVTVTAPTANDACKGTITGTTTDPLTYDAQGTYTITWTYDDGNGNTSTQTQAVIVDDTTAPVPAVAQLPEINGQCAVTVTAPTANDACAGTITGTTTDPLTYDAQGTYTITWTYDDGNGNTSNQTQTVIVDDTTAPVPAVAQLPTISSQCSVTVTAPTANDACEGTIIGTTTDPLTYDAQGTYTITWTYDDGNGNTSTQTQTVIVDDTTAPVPTLATLPTISGQCSVTVTAPTANDSCEGTITGTTTNPLTYDAQGTYTINWTYDDGNGNTSTQTQTVIVDDTTAPVPAVAQLPVASGQCSVTVTAPTANDACEGTITGTTTDPLTYDAQGTYTITWTYDDGNGNTSTQTQTLIVDDTTAPVPAVAQLPVISGQCSVTVTAPTANDSCEGTITGTTTNPLTYDAQGTYTINWTYDDGNGNTSTQTQTVIVDDTTAPVPAVAQLPVASGQCSVTVTAPTANDACEGTITGTTTDPLTYDAQGTYTITWTYDDGNGNTATQEQTVVVDDTTAPVPAVAQLPVITGQCSVTVTAPTANDACEGTITGTTTDPLTYDAQGTYTINWTYDDGNGNTSTQTQTVIVDDTTEPVPVVTQLPVISGQCSVTVIAPTANDACEGTITGTTSDPLTYDAQGTYTITWTYDDGNGNTSTQTQTVIMDDTTAPVPAVPQLPVVSGQCSVTVTAPTANDACEGTITGTTTDPTSYAEQGTYTITWTYDDGNGNTATQEQTVVVDDTTAPVPAVAQLPTISGQCSVTVIAPTANDACEGTITGTTSDPLTYDAQGTYTITWTYDDGNGNTSTQTQTVIMDDTTAPVPAVPQLPVVSGQCSVTVTAPTANDACEGTITGTTTDLLTYDTQGTYTITWTYDDGNGNTATQEQTVVVDDTTAPVPAVAQLPVITGQCSVTVTAPTANDACEGTITGTTTDPLTYDTQGTYTITWTYDDGNGNTSTQTQTVIVDDTTAPVPTVAELPTISGQCEVTVIAPTANDACKGTITGTTTDPLTYDAQGTYTITWTYDDGNGNTSTQTQTVIVDDTTAPVPAVAQLPVVSGQCAVEVSAPKSTDACEGEITGTTTDPLTYDTQGTYTITWTYDDGNGNTSTQTQTVVVDDTIAPVPTLATLPTISGQCSVTVTAPTANDACEGTITGTTTDPLTYDAQGTYTINWTYDDGNGNTSTQTQTVIVDDTTAPVPTLSTLATITGQCSVTVTAPTANDACKGIITGTTTDPLTYDAQGTYTITWTYDDGNGNTVTQEQTVIVDDTTAPVPAVAQLPTISSQCSVTVTAPTANDACAGTITGTTTDPLNYSNQGTYIITWTYNDGNGNSVTQQQTVIVSDVTNPTWSTTPGSLNRTISCGQSNLLAQAQLLAPIAGDNCSVMAVEKTAGVFVPSGPNGAGTITNTWVARDVNSNLSQVFTQVITVEGIQIDASASSTPIQIGTGATLSASVTPAIAGVSVNFYLDDVLKGSSITNSSGTATLTVSGLGLDVYKVTAVVGDGCAESIAYLPVYDPNGNFVTGGGWINSPEGALIGTTTVGKANFGFVSKYKKGSNQVDGNTEFQFTAGNLSFKSTLHEAGTLVISGRKATYRGDGMVNGAPGYRFTITAIDGHWNGGTGPDQFRIKIWGSNGVLYDNGLGADDNSDIATSLGGGSIVIHEAKARGTKRVVTDLITVPWNTSAETIKQKVDQMSTAWFESRKLEMTLDANSYDPLTPGFYELKADLVENEFFKLDEPISIQVLVQDKPKALDIELSTNSISNQMKAGDQIAILSTVDPVDNIHTYRIEGNPDLVVEGNRLLWKGTGMPEAQLKLTVFSTDRAGQTISKEVTLFRELKIGEFLIYPNPAAEQTNVLVELDQPSQVSLRVFDAVGRMVISDQFSRETTFVQTLDLSGLAPGMYTVQIQLGKMLMTKRLIKE
ncbi:HYR-like domain-containing protein [Algoriphagus lacus]|nr:T9SS type A sorting domain-containing protein [Algoriphagus lacus]